MCELHQIYYLFLLRIAGVVKAIKGSLKDLVEVNTFVSSFIFYLHFFIVGNSDHSAHSLLWWMGGTLLLAVTIVPVRYFSGWEQVCYWQQPL